MYDTLIRNGTVVDGTGTERRKADVAIQDGVIAGIGRFSPSDARQVIDADGLIVAPGFVDIHTHYDAQLFWDPTASPSPYHGVTTVIGGLCGFTLQPISPESAGYIVPMLSQVEDIPLSALQAGVPCDWRSFKDFRTRLEGRMAVNAGFCTGHSALRRLVMGERAVGQHATDADIAQMKTLLRASLDDGALGFSTSNSTTHNDHTGGPVPSRFAEHREFVELAGACRDYEGSMVEIQPGLGFDDQAAQLITDMSLASQRIVNWNAQFISTANEAERALIARQLAMSDYARARGGDTVGLSVPVSATVHIDLLRGGGFDNVPGWETLFRLPPAERIAALKDPARRAEMRRQGEAGSGIKIVRQIMDPDFMVVEKGQTAKTQAFSGKTLREVGALLGVDPFDAMFDVAIDDGLKTLFTFRTVGDDAATYAFRAQLWRDDRLCLGGSDAGAHVETIDTFSYFTKVLDRAVRTFGVVSLEECIHYFTQAPATLLGLRDRGTLRTGWRADITVFDEKTVACRPVTMRHDFPGGAGRLYAEADGMAYVMVNGTVILDHGHYTGALPGTFLQRARDTQTVPIPKRG